MPRAGLAKPSALYTCAARLKTYSRVTTHQPTQAISIVSGGGEITVMKTAFYSQPEKFAQAQLARVLMRQACGKMLAEEAAFEKWDRLTYEQQQDFIHVLQPQLSWGRWARRPTPSKALALKSGV